VDLNSPRPAIYKGIQCLTLVVRTGIEPDISLSIGAYANTPPDYVACLSKLSDCPQYQLMQGIEPCRLLHITSINEQNRTALEIMTGLEPVS